MEKEKIVNKVTYKATPYKDLEGILNVRAIVKIDFSTIEIVFRCLKIEWEDDFDTVETRFKEAINDFYSYLYL